jgi:predicted permease
MTALLRRLLAVIRRNRLERDLDDELTFHLAMRQNQEVRRGRSPTEAEVASRRGFGSVLHVKEQTKEAWVFAWLDGTVLDIRFALRGLLKNPGFTSVAVLSLALGIGANTAIFSIVNAVLLRPLPYPDSDRLIRIIEHLSPDAGATLGYPQRLATLPATDLGVFREKATLLSHVGAFTSASLLLARDGETIRVEGTRLTPSVFAMLKVQPLLGRTFEPPDELRGGDASVVLSHAAWQRYFGGTPDILSRNVTLDGRRYEVIGVMPPGFRFPDAYTELWIPYVLAGRAAPIARLADGVTLASASAQVGGLLRELQAKAAKPAAKPSSFELETVREQLVAPVRPALIALAAAVGLVLLIACVNVALLLLARTAGRRREFAVRAALGAGRIRLAGQLLTENAMLAIAGAAAGTAVAFGALQLLRKLGTSLPRQDLTPGVSIPRLDEIAIDLPALAFTLGLSLITGTLFGLAPALRHSRPQRTNMMGEGTATAGSGFNLLRRQSPQGLLIVAEIAMAMLLLVGGGLLAHSFIKLAKVDVGYDPVNVLTFNVPSGNRLRPETFNDDLVARLQSLPAVRAVGYTEVMPMAVFRSGGPFRPAQPAPDAAARPPSPIDYRYVSRDFMGAMGMRVIEGRGFDEEDTADGTPKLLINRKLARSGYLGPKPVGSLVYPMAPNRAWEVIGIVDDVHQYGLNQEPDAQVYINAQDLPLGNPYPYFAVRAERNPIALVPNIRGIVRQLDPAGIVDNVATMQQVVANSISRPRLYAVLLGIFGAVAATLAAIGIYGVMAYSVTQRTREIGIRMALGARRREVLRLVLNQSLVLTAIGIILGIAGAAAVTGYLRGMLFGVTPLDPATFVVVALMFSAVAMLAAFVPARRATKVDPLVALRCE